MHLGKYPQDTSSSIFSTSSVEAENRPSITVHLIWNQIEKENDHHVPGPRCDVKPQRQNKLDPSEKEKKTNNQTQQTNKQK